MSNKANLKIFNNQKTMVRQKKSSNNYNTI